MTNSRYKLGRPVHVSNQRRQSPVTDIHSLTVLVLESYGQTFCSSIPKVHKRYEKLLRDLKARQ